MRKVAVISALLIAFMLVFAGCADEAAEPTEPAREYTGEDDFFTLSCEVTGETEFSVKQLMTEYPAETREIVRETDDGEDRYDIKGVLLEELLSEAGAEIGDLDGVRFIAGDGYAVDVPQEILEEHEVILAYEIAGEPLWEDTRPLRAFIPGEEAMYWVKNLVEVELGHPEETAAEIKQLVFIETAAEVIDSVPYHDGYDEEQKAVKTVDLLADVTLSDSVCMMATDGFEKTEDYDVFVDAFIVMSSDDAPAFRSPEMPRGMHVRDLAWFTVGDTAFISVSRSPELLGEASVDEDVGVSLSALAEELGLLDADEYVLEASDGYTAEVSSEDLEAGIVFFRDSGEVASVFEDLPRSTAVKDLLMLKVAD